MREQLNQRHVLHVGMKCRLYFWKNFGNGCVPFQAPLLNELRDNSSGHRFGVGAEMPLIIDSDRRRFSPFPHSYRADCNEPFARDNSAGKRRHIDPDAGNPVNPTAA